MVRLNGLATHSNLLCNRCMQSVAYNIPHCRAVTRVVPTRVELELDLSQLGRVEFFSTRVFELHFYVLRGQILGQLMLK